jgi:dephospho-CoA kinase
MLLIGLTGGIGSGKSTAAEFFRLNGFEIIDTDELAREATAPHTPVAQKMAETFGPQYIRSDGSLDRAKLAQVVFSDPHARKLLEDITHPAILSLMWQRVERLRARSSAPAAVVLVIPLLFEVGMQDQVDRIVLAWASPQEQLGRIMRRDNLTEQEAMKRLSAQLPIEQKKDRAHWIVNTEASLEGVREQVERICQEVRLLAGEKGGKRNSTAGAIYKDASRC